MIRGIAGSQIFKGDQDRQDFITRTGEVAQETRTRVLAWVLMRNHVHLLLFSGPPGISRFMRRILTGYAQGYNRRHGRSGHLFQNRYKSIVCEEDTYLLELVRYIHLNPFRASVVKSLKELDRYSGVVMPFDRTCEERLAERDYVLRQFHKGREGGSCISPIYRTGERSGSPAGVSGRGIDSESRGLVAGCFFERR
jgi:REP element-mobilizing transposase RayT